MLSTSQQAHRRVAFEQIEAQSGCLPALAGEAAVAFQEEAGVALCDGGELGDILLRSDPERLLA